MPTETSLRETLEHFREQERKLLDDLRAVKFTVRSIERELGIASQDAGGFEASGGNGGDSLIDVVVPSASGSMIGGKPSLRPDEFFGLTHAEAARRYLKKVGHAVSFEELGDALRQGGCKLSGANARQVLYISLIRNTKDFVPPRPGFVGLRDFYPGGGRALIERPAKRQAKRAVPKKSPAPARRENRGRAKNVGPAVADKGPREASQPTPKAQA